MGALTLKSFPFELRGWDIEEFEAIDPTDSFGSNIKVYVNNNQIVQIEPDYDTYTSNTWITDKTRQFFDGMFAKQDNIDNFDSKSSWSLLFKNLNQNLYIFNMCNNKFFTNQFFTIIFENVNLEILNLLNIISQTYSFIKIRKAENIKLNNDLEYDFQLNSVSNKTQLNNSEMCLLISTDTRYQGYRLNLNLRQRFFKGNFKCILIGSLIDITFPLSYIGSNVKIIKDIIEGNNLNCRDLIKSKNPLAIINDEFLKRNDDLLYALKLLNTTKYLRLNTLNSSLNVTGNINLTNFTSFNTKDLINLNSLYLINVHVSKLPNIEKIIQIKFLNFTKQNFLELNSKNIIINQNVNTENSRYLDSKSATAHLPSIFFEDLCGFAAVEKDSYYQEKTNNYFYLPTSMFFESNQSFINTEGFIKRNNKVIFGKKIKNSWQILRKFLKNFQKKTLFLLNKDKNLISFNIDNTLNFKNYVSLHFSATQNLTNLNYYLNIKNKTFYITNKVFKTENKKIFNNKLKYWLDDFFTGGKDDFSQNSLILINCSTILRTESTNFF